MNLVSTHLTRTTDEFFCHLRHVGKEFGVGGRRLAHLQALPSIANRMECLLVQQFALFKSLHKHKVEKYCLLEGVPKAKDEIVVP